MHRRRSSKRFHSNYNKRSSSNTGSTSNKKKKLNISGMYHDADKSSYIMIDEGTKNYHYYSISWSCTGDILAIGTNKNIQLYYSNGKLKRNNINYNNHTINHILFHPNLNQGVLAPFADSAHLLVAVHKYFLHNHPYLRKVLNIKLCLL